MIVLGRPRHVFEEAVRTRPKMVAAQRTRGAGQRVAMPRLQDLLATIAYIAQ
jgi:hypothetical protein